MTPGQVANLKADDLQVSIARKLEVVTPLPLRPGRDLERRRPDLHAVFGWRKIDGA